MNEGKKNAGLARSIGLFALVAYGVGDMVGAGIYGTIGQAAGLLGNSVWLAFVVAMAAAMLTGLTYASLSARYPRAAGAAFVTHRAYRRKFLSYAVGLAVTASGLTSMATGSRVFAETLQHLTGGTGIPVWVIFLGFIGILTAVNLRGIRECMWTNIVCTAIEVGGLLLIIAVSLPFFGSVNYLETPPSSGGLGAPLVLSGAVLAFYAFVGFEDLLNLAEEVKNPTRTMPRGILVAVACTTVIYLLVSLAAVSVVPYAQLADMKTYGAPMTQIIQRAAPWIPPHFYTGITLFAVANTALINFIMGSRLIYGMAKQGLLPGGLNAVHPTRHTPHRAILLIALLVAALAFAGDIRQLASATSLLLLTVFGLMNAALIVLKLRPDEPKGSFEVPFLVPVLGFCVCAGLIASRLAHTASGLGAPLIAGAMLAGIAILYFVRRPKNVVME